MTDILEIEDGVLKKCTDKGAVSVVIPEGVTEIGNAALSEWNLQLLNSAEFTFKFSLNLLLNSA